MSQRSGYRTWAVGAGLTSWLAAAAAAQQPAVTPPSQPAATPPAASGGPVPAGGEDDKGKLIEEIKKSEELVLSGKGGYNYDPAGRRDPFVDPLKSASEKEGSQPRPEGWPGMLIGEVQLQGITVYGDEPIAIFLGTDGVGYFAREGDELWDGKIIQIDFEERKVVFQQKVEDPSSALRFREVVKKLNP